MPIFRFLNRRAVRRSRQKPKPFTTWEALAEELCGGDDTDPDLQRALEQRRQPQEIAEESSCVGGDEESALRKKVIQRMHAARRSALCFSGGGIRSATFGLGVLQGLAAHSCGTNPEADPELLGELDYLSTVSGGGYLGSWFSAWAMRANSASEVIRELASHPEAEWEPEPGPLRRLRTFTNYLNPKLGLLSADTWTLVATMLRNILLNWLVLMPLIASVLVVPRILYKLVLEYPDYPWPYLLPCAAGFLVIGVAYMAVDLPSVGDSRLSQQTFLWFSLGPLLLAALGFVLYWAWQGYLDQEPTVTGFVLYGIGIMGAGVALGTLLASWKQRRLNWQWLLKGGGFAIAAGALGGLFACWMTWGFTDAKTGNLYNERVYSWLAIPCLLAVFALSQGVLVGLASLVTGDEDREWFSRAMAWILIAIVCGVGFSGIALMPPVLVRWLPPLSIQALITAVSGAVASRLGASPQTAGTRELESDPSNGGGMMPAWLRRSLPSLIMIVFLIALMSLIATFNELATNDLAEWLQNPPGWSPLAKIAHPDPVLIECLFVVLLAVPALILSRVIDANKFSLHAMYRNRLIRTFLGASNRDRSPNPFTGFDPADNFPVAMLPAKPLHVINMTLNLVKGENLAWQQRKGESFTATKYRVGSCRIGYQSSYNYAGPLTVGGAIAISGAAANPSMGYASSPLLSVVMMLFNARLGAWLPNPGEAGRRCWTKRGPTFSVMPFIDEAFGRTTDHHAWVNLSDGGHFENLGIYEMVLRRCSTIIAVDGSGDPSFYFDDLGNAIRKIYVDMGIPVEFPDGIAIRKNPSPESRHVAIGRVRYSAVDGPGAPDGTIIYIKSSLTGNEPEDVRNYAAENPAFPHQSTADQWFDEAQFEAHRRLGFHVAEEIFQGKDDTASLSEFAALARKYCGVNRNGASSAAG
jgi:Patatin-like phospholipase